MRKANRSRDFNPKKGNRAASFYSFTEKHSVQVKNGENPDLNV